MDFWGLLQKKRVNKIGKKNAVDFTFFIKRAFGIKKQDKDLLFIILENESINIFEKS